MNLKSMRCCRWPRAVAWRVPGPSASKCPTRLPSRKLTGKKWIASSGGVSRETKTTISWPMSSKRSMHPPASTTKSSLNLATISTSVSSRRFLQANLRTTLGTSWTLSVSPPSTPRLPKPSHIPTDILPRILETAMLAKSEHSLPAVPHVPRNVALQSRSDTNCWSKRCSISSDEKSMRWSTSTWRTPTKTWPKKLPPEGASAAAAPHYVEPGVKSAKIHLIIQNVENIGKPEQNYDYLYYILYQTSSR